MVIVDTSAWIYFFDRRKTSVASKSVSDYFHNSKDRFVTTDLVIEETHKWLVHHTFSPNKACEILHQFNQEVFADIIPIEEADRIHAVLLVKKYIDQKLSYTDAITVAMMKRMKIKHVCSFDAHFDLIPGIQRLP